VALSWRIASLEFVLGECTVAPPQTTYLIAIYPGQTQCIGTGKNI